MAGACPVIEPTQLSSLHASLDRERRKAGPEFQFVATVEDMAIGHAQPDAVRMHAVERLRSWLATSPPWALKVPPTRSDIETAVDVLLADCDNSDVPY